LRRESSSRKPTTDNSPITKKSYKDVEIFFPVVGVPPPTTIG